MVSKEDIVNTFSAQGYTIEDQKVIGTLCSLCNKYGLDEKKLSDEYSAFAQKNALDVELLNEFEYKVLKKNNKVIEKNPKLSISIDNDQDEEISTPRLAPNPFFKIPGSSASVNDM